MLKFSDLNKQPKALKPGTLVYLSSATVIFLEDTLRVEHVLESCLVLLSPIVLLSHSPPRPLLVFYSFLHPQMLFFPFLLLNLLSLSASPPFFMSFWPRSYFPNWLRGGLIILRHPCCRLFYLSACCHPNPLISKPPLQHTLLLSTRLSSWCTSPRCILMVPPLPAGEHSKE